MQNGINSYQKLKLSFKEDDEQFVKNFSFDFALDDELYFILDEHHGSDVCFYVL
jgi:hypothetical protein